MDAIKLLIKQHHEVNALYKQFEASDDKRHKQGLFMQIADSLAVHAAIEERFFYPAVRKQETKTTDDEVDEAEDEHLSVKKTLIDALAGLDSPGFDGKVAAVMGVVKHHVEEEESEMLPRAQKLMSKETLEALGQIMEAEAMLIKEAGAPHDKLRVATDPSRLGAV